MSSPDLLRPFPSHQFDLIEGGDRVVVFAVLGERRMGSTILVHSPTLLLRLEQLTGDVEVVVFVEDSPPDPATIATINDMLASLGSEDGLVQFQVPAEAIKLVKEPASTAQPLIGQGIDRSTLVSFCPPEVLRAAALAAAVATPPTELWVNPAGLVANNGGRIATYPRSSSPA